MTSLAATRSQMGRARSPVPPGGSSKAPAPTGAATGAYQLELIAPHCWSLGPRGGCRARRLRRAVRRPGPVWWSPTSTRARWWCMARRFADRPEVEARRSGPRRPGHALEIGTPVAAVVAINVLEHIEQDADVLHAAVRPGRARRPASSCSCPATNSSTASSTGSSGTSAATRRRRSPTHSCERGRPAEVRPVNLLGGLAWWATYGGRRRRPEPAGWCAPTTAGWCRRPASSSAACGRRSASRCSGSRGVLWSPSRDGRVAAVGARPAVNWSGRTAVPDMATTTATPCHRPRCRRERRRRPVEDRARSYPRKPRRGNLDRANLT